MGILTEKPQDIGIDSKIQAKLDKNDLNNEMAGIDTGKTWRFLSNNSPSNPHVRKKLETEREFRSMLDMLLTQDPHYAALYKKVTEKLDKAQQAVNSALIYVNQRLEASDRKLQLLRDNAAQLPDGTKVFQSNNGSIITEHGKRLSDEKAKNIVFPKNAPQWETYKSEKENHDALFRDKKKLIDYQTDVLDDINRRMKDKDNPLSKEELEDLNNDFPDFPTLETTTINVPAENTMGHPSVAETIENKSENSPQSISITFNVANDEILNLAELEAVAPQKSVTPAP